MARKRKQDDGEEQVARNDSQEEPVAEPVQDVPEEMVIAELGEHTPNEEPVQAEPVLPSEDDLERQGFSADEVSRLVLVSKRQEDSAESSAESQFAEAAMRRLRFTRWLIEHGRLDEWSA
jgi:hypothetical protein